MDGDRLQSPPIGDLPWSDHSARNLAADVRAGRLTCETLWDAADRAIAAGEPEIGAFVNLEDTDARRRRLSESRVTGEHPLSGLPIGIKDVFDTADLPTEYGSSIYEGHRPASDAVVVALAKAAGAAIYGKTVTTEFASFSPGRTRNPHNLEHTPGGSSSGSAAAVAAGMVPFAVGTQTGGSVIRPAAFCGVVGYKPTFNLIPTVGLKTFAWSLDTVGVFAGTVDDASFLVEAITGRPLKIAPPRVELRVGICETPMIGAADTAMRDALATAADMLAAARISVRTVTLPPIFAEAHEAHTVVNDHEGAVSLTYEMQARPDAISSILRGIIRNGLAFDLETYDAARKAFKTARLALVDVWSDVDVLLAPSAPGAAPKGLETTGDSVFNRLWTALGVPCVNIPAFVDDAGLPLGVQVIGPAMKDAETLAAAAAIQDLLQD